MEKLFSWDQNEHDIIRSMLWPHKLFGLHIAVPDMILVEPPPSIEFTFMDFLVDVTKPMCAEAIIYTSLHN